MYPNIHLSSSYPVPLSCLNNRYSWKTFIFLFPFSQQMEFLFISPHPHHVKSLHYSMYGYERALKREWLLKTIKMHARVTSMLLI